MLGNNILPKILCLLIKRVDRIVFLSISQSHFEFVGIFFPLAIFTREFSGYFIFF